VQGHDAEHVEGAHMGHADLDGAVAATTTGTGADTAYTGDDHHDDDDEDGVSDADDGEASSANSEEEDNEDDDDENDEDDDDDDDDGDNDDDENGDDNAANAAEVPHGEAHHDIAADADGDANAGGDARRRYMLRMMGNVNPDLHADEPGNPAVVGADGARVQHDRHHDADPDHPEHDLPREERIKPKPFMHHMRARWRELDGPTRGDHSYDCLTEMCCDKRLCSLRAAQVLISCAI